MKLKIKEFFERALTPDIVDYIKNDMIGSNFDEKYTESITDNLYEVYSYAVDIPNMILESDGYDDDEEQLIYDLKVKMDDFLYHCAISSIYLISFVSSKWEKTINKGAGIEQSVEGDKHDENGKKIDVFIELMESQKINIKEETVEKIVVHCQRIASNISKLTEAVDKKIGVYFAGEILASMGILQYQNIELFKAANV